MEDWVDACKRMGQREFTERYPHPFVAVVQISDAEIEELRTVGQPGGVSASATVPRMDFQDVYPVIDTDANPYANRVMVGRARNCDVILRDASVSKFHADFRQLPDGDYSLTDQESKNGTWVRGERLAPRTPCTLADWDRLRFGEVIVMFLSAARLRQYLR